MLGTDGFTLFDQTLTDSQFVPSGGQLSHRECRGICCFQRVCGLLFGGRRSPKLGDSIDQA